MATAKRIPNQQKKVGLALVIKQDKRHANNDAEEIVSLSDNQIRQHGEEQGDENPPVRPHAGKAPAHHHQEARHRQYPKGKGHHRDEEAFRVENLPLAYITAPTTDRNDNAMRIKQHPMTNFSASGLYESEMRGGEGCPVGLGRQRIPAA